MQLENNNVCIWQNDAILKEETLDPANFISRDIRASKYASVDQIDDNFWRRVIGKAANELLEFNKITKYWSQVDFGWFFWNHTTVDKLTEQLCPVWNTIFKSHILSYFLNLLDTNL